MGILTDLGWYSYNLYYTKKYAIQVPIEIYDSYVS